MPISSASLGIIAPSYPKSCTGVTYAYSVNWVGGFQPNVVISTLLCYLCLTLSSFYPALWVSSGFCRFQLCFFSSFGRCERLNAVRWHDWAVCDCVEDRVRRVIAVGAIAGIEDLRMDFGTD